MDASLNANKSQQELSISNRNNLHSDNNSDAKKSKSSKTIKNEKEDGEIDDEYLSNQKHATQTATSKSTINNEEDDDDYDDYDLEDDSQIANSKKSIEKRGNK